MLFDFNLRRRYVKALVDPALLPAGFAPAVDFSEEEAGEEDAEMKLNNFAEDNGRAGAG